MSKNFSPTFGQRLKTLRGNRPQLEFAKMLGIPHQSTYCRYEQGRLPKLNTLKSMANRLGVTVDHLTGENVEVTPSIDRRLNFSPIGNSTRESGENFPSNDRSTETILTALKICVRHLEGVPLVNAGMILLEIEEYVAELRRRIALQPSGESQNLYKIEGSE